PALVPWPLSVLAFVARLAARCPMPHDQHCLGIDGLFGKAAQHFSVVWIFQLFHRLSDGQPLEVVDFSVRTELAVDSARRPVPHLLDALLDRITDGGESPAEVRRVSRLLV